MRQNHITRWVPPPAITSARGRTGAAASGATIVQTTLPDPSNERRSSSSGQTGLKQARCAAHRSGGISVGERDAIHPFGAVAEEAT